MRTNEAKLEQIMLELGYPENLLGTQYVRVAVQTYRPGMSMTMELYPAIARACESTPSRVERAIRHATARAFDKAGWSDAPQKYFGNSINPSTGTPRNGELIARLERLTRDD